MAVNRYGNEPGIYDYLPGNSGIWGDQATPAGGAIPGGARPGMGLPGDRYRVASGLTPLSPLAPRAPSSTATWDQNRAMYVNPQTGQPFTGRLPSGQYATGGRVTGEPVPYSNQVINPNDAAARYKPVDIVKDPGVATGATDLLETFKKSAADSLKGFDDYLATFKDASKSAFDKTNAATDIGPLSSTLRGDQAKYAGALDQSAADIAALNAKDATAQRGIVTQANALLPEMDANARDALDLGLGAVQQNVSRYKTTSGTPSSLGSAEMQIQNAANRNLLVPFELAKTQRKMDILQNLALPVQRDITNRETSRITQFDPYVAAQEFASGTQTEQTIQGLKQQVAGLSWDNATRYMQSLGVPAQIQQQILSGQIQNLGGIAQLNAGSRYQGLQDILGANPSSPAYYNLAQPGLPAPSRYSPVTGTPQGNNAPVQVGGTGTNGAPGPRPGYEAIDKAYFAQTGFYPNDPNGNFSQAAYDAIAASLNPQASRYAGVTNGANWGSPVDPAGEVTAG